MINFLKQLFDDPEVKKLRKALRGKVLVEVLKTKIKRNEIFWIGRSQYDEKPIRLGVKTEQGRTYFIDFDDERISEYEILTPIEADQIDPKNIKN